MAAPAWWRAHDRPANARRRGLSMLALLCAAVALGISSLPPWRLMEARAFDFLSTFHAPALPAGGPVIVAIDEPSLAEIGLQWPWPRDLHARLVRALRAAGAKAIGLDIIFAEPSTRAADAALAASLGPDVVLAGDETVIETARAVERVRAEPLAEFTATGARTGIASVALDRDGVLRRLPAYPDGFAAGLLAVSGIAGASADGTRLLQSFGPARTYPTVAYYQALEPERFLPEGTFQDRVVLIGLSLQNVPTIDTGTADAMPTPDTVNSGRLVAGVEIQATIYDNLANDLFIRPAGAFLSAATILVAAAFGAAMAWRGTDRNTLLLGAAGAAAIVVCAYAVLRFGRVFVPPLAPTLAFAMVAAGQAGIDFSAERRLRRGIVRAFSQYLSPALVEKLASDPSQLRLGGETRELTVLFCDVRGFTTIAESLKNDPQRLTGLINRLLTPLSEVVLAAGGTIDKYIGDCLMAFWNAPLDDPDHALHAVQAALGILDAVDQLNRELRSETGSPVVADLRIGIGINTGECVVGNMGSERRFDYSVLGDTVNLASRLEGASKEVGVPLLLGEATAAAVGSRMPLLPLARIKVKGRAEPVVVLTALADASAATREAHRAILDPAADPDRAAELLAEIESRHPLLAPYYANLFSGAIQRP